MAVVISFEHCAAVTDVATSALAVAAGEPCATDASTSSSITETTIVALDVLGGAGDAGVAQGGGAISEDRD